MKRPNLVFVFADQWRAQALGYAGDPNVKTPRIDEFAGQSVNFCNAVSGCPVCSPYRASLLTGQYPLTTQMVVNDQSIKSANISFADALNDAGYETVYIGKWHIDGHGRQKYVPPERRLGFKLWLGYECTHDYIKSYYYEDGPEPKLWDGYDAKAQTEKACEFIREFKEDENPFAIFLSWGPPHAPYHTAPEEFRKLYDKNKIELRPNVPEEETEEAKEMLAGYYAHCTALDHCFGLLLDELEASGIADNTLVVFTSDHGDLLGCHGVYKKQWAYEESLMVPFLMRWPEQFKNNPQKINEPINAPDVMPTILSLCNVKIPETVEGTDFSPLIYGEKVKDSDAALLACYFPFHQLTYKTGGKDYRGLRTERYTYLITHDGPWWLFDNEKDPCQMNNLVDDPDYKEILTELDGKLQKRLKQCNDSFEKGYDLLKRLKIRLNEKGDVFFE